jgi:AAA domain/Primase C terminal 1 (PriCT-1)
MTEAAVYTDAEFQHALASAVAAHAPTAHRGSGRRRLIDACDDIPTSLDWSSGFAEGQRNVELARYAGSCLGRGMTEVETLQICRAWNNNNNPPLPDSEVVSTVASIARTAARKQGAPVVTPNTHTSSEFIFDGDVAATPPKMLVKKLLPASGIAFIGGQSSAGKTFVAVALGVALASSTDFFKHRVKERVGVLYIAAEGGSNFAARVIAAKIAAGVKGSIPFAWSSVVPPLRTKEEIIAFAEKLRVFGQNMLHRCGVRLGAVFIDTVAACFSLQDENSNAEVSRVCGIMRYIGDSIGAVVIPVHHYGKDAETGLRGASAWRGAADVVISVTAKIEPITGQISNRGLAVAKARDAEQGPVAPIRLDYVKLGVDEDGDEFGTLVVRADPERSQYDLTRKKGLKWLQFFDSACKQALGRLSEDVPMGNQGRVIRAVELKHVRAEFCSVYVTGDDDQKKAEQTRERAWRRALEGMAERLPGYSITKGPDGREWLYLTAHDRMRI